MVLTIMTAVGVIFTTVGGTGFIYESRKEKKEKKIVADMVAAAEVMKAKAKAEEAIRKAEAEAKLREEDAKKAEIISTMKKDIVDKARKNGVKNLTEVEQYIDDVEDEIKKSLRDMSEDEIGLTKVFVEKCVEEIFNMEKADNRGNSNNKAETKHKENRNLSSSERKNIVKKAEKYIKEQEEAINEINGNLDKAEELIKEAEAVSETIEAIDNAKNLDEIDDIVKSEDFVKLVNEAEREAIAEEKAKAGKSKKNKNK